MLSKPSSTIAEFRCRAPSRPRWTSPGSSSCDWIWKTLSPKIGSVTCWTSSPLIPIASRASRTPSSSVGLLQRRRDPGAGLEVDAEVELLGRQRQAADQQDHAGDREEPAARAHEVEVPAPALAGGAERARRAQQARAAHAAEQRLGEDDRGQQRDDRADAEGEGEALDARRSPARRG